MYSPHNTNLSANVPGWAAGDPAAQMVSGVAKHRVAGDQPFCVVADRGLVLEPDRPVQLEHVVADIAPDRADGVFGRRDAG